MSNTKTLTIMKKAGNIQNEKKLQKKQAEKLLREGLKSLEQIPAVNDFVEKMSLYSAIEEKFNRAISLLPSHAETLFQLAILKIERCNLIQEEATAVLSSSTEDIQNIEQILLQIIVNDTSRRGETTGHAHRTLASLYLQHFIFFLPSHQNSYFSLLKRSLMHLERTRDILSSHSTELDLYFFEYCEAFNAFWETCWMTPTGPSCDHDDATIIQECFLIFKQTIDSCLLCSNGSMDREIYLLYGTFLNSYCEFVTTVTNTSPFSDHLRSVAFLSFLHDTVIETIRSVFGTLCFLGNFLWDESCVLEALLEKERRSDRSSDEVMENIECLSLSGDLMRSILEIWDWRADSQFASPTSLESIHEESRRLIHVRLYIKVIFGVHQSHCSAEIIFSNLCSLAEDLMFLGSLIDRHQQDLEISKFSTVFNKNLLSLLRHESSLGEGSLPLSPPSTNYLFDLCFSDLTCQLYESSKYFFLTAVPLFESQSRDGDDAKGEETEEKGDVIEASDYCTLLYNLVCVCWQLRQSEDANCETYLSKYVQSLSALRNCQPSEVLDEVMTEIQRDKDIPGFYESEICERIRHHL